MPRSSKHQQGSVAIELAALFAVFFVTVYAIIAYSIPMLLTLSLRQISADAARAAIKVDPAAANYTLAVSEEVTETISASWLPDKWRDGDCPPPDNNGWTALPGSPSYGYFRIDNGLPGDPRYLLHVCLQRKYNRSGADNETAIIPPLDLLIFSVPSLPTGEDGNTVLRGQSLIRL